MLKRIFLSHAESDAVLARTVHDELRRNRPDFEVFVSSLPGAIPTGSEWLGEIKRQLKAADAYLALLTPASVQRQWVWFESGAAFMSDKLFVGVCASGLRKAAVPSPLSGHQLLSFDSAADCLQVFKEFGIVIDDPESLWQAIRLAADEGVRQLSAADAWAGVPIGKRFFAWDGPLDGLDDKEAIVCPPDLIEALQAAGMTPTFGNRDRLEQHLANDRLQVFLTDRSTWKRPVVNAGNQLLLVHGSREQRRSAFDAARRVLQRNEQRQRTAAMLHSDTGVRAANDEFYRLADALDALVRQLPDLPLSVERFAADWSLVVRYGRQFRLTVQWLSRALNSLDDSQLVIAEWQGYGNRFVQLNNDPPLARTDFRFDVSPQGEYAWRQKSGEPIFFSSVGLADWCITRLLDRVAASAK